MYRLGIDIGGTFTDFRIVNTQTGWWASSKSPTDHGDPARGVMAGLEPLCAEHGIELEQIETIGHGTTLGVNAVVERTGATLGLLVTEGFRDILQMRRLRLERPINLYPASHEPLIPRRRVHEIRERKLSDGTSLQAPAKADVVGAVKTLLNKADISGLVVSLLHSYRYPEHEQLVRAYIEESFPSLSVTISSDVLPQMREYERTIAAVLNAYTAAKLDKYAGELERSFRDQGFTGPFFVTASNGGKILATDLQSTAFSTLLSGPASGVRAAVGAAQAAGLGDLITLDMGGTTTDVAVLRNGEPILSRESHLGDYPITAPTVEVTSVGAGGGSIARVDGQGVLRVGPESAGSYPGPACYGRGGAKATITDALLVLGFINAEAFAGGTMKLDTAAAVGVIRSLADALGLGLEETAGAVIDVAIANMYRGIRGVLGQCGQDATSMSLMAFGGAGPLLGVRVAQEMEFKSCIVPPSPGTLCGQGALLAEHRRDFVVPLNLLVGPSAQDALRDALNVAYGQARNWLDEYKVPQELRRTEVRAAMRYEGQAWEIDVMLPEFCEGENLVKEIRKRFDEEHLRLYAHADASAIPLIVELHSSAIAPESMIPVKAPEAKAQPVRSRPVYDAGAWREAGIYDRRSLPVGVVINGPAVIDEEDTTTVVPFGTKLTVDHQGNLILERN